MFEFAYPWAWALLLLLLPLFWWVETRRKRPTLVVASARPFRSGAKRQIPLAAWLYFLGALLIVAAVYLPLSGLMVMFPLLGLVLNGTSSVLYGAVPDLAGAGKREQAFALFYTGTIGGGALAPVVFGGVGDALGVPVAMMVLAGILGVTLPLAWVVQRRGG